MTKSNLPKRNSTDPVYLQVYKRILKEIAEKKRCPGDKLPADTYFAKELQINHLTLKKALNRLASEGYLVRVRGRGTFVADKLPKINLSASGKRVTVIYDTIHEESSHSDIFLSIYKGIGELGLNLELLSANNSRTTQFKQIIELFSDPESAGCIVWPLMDMRQLKNLAMAKPENYPLIFINHKPELDIRGIDFSGYDDFGAGRKLGEYIKASGFEQIVVCQAEIYKKMTTNILRIAGIQSSFGSVSEIFSDYDYSSRMKNLLNFLEQLDSPEKTAVIFISESDYTEAKEVIQKRKLTPFAFFTGQKPQCKGISLSSKLMAENSVNILNARRNGDNSFAIIKRITGTLV